MIYVVGDENGHSLLGVGGVFVCFPLYGFRNLGLVFAQLFLA